VKIIHVATYVSADGAFGGPIAVAASQLVELARRGHDVELVAGSDGVTELDLPGVRVTLFKAKALLPLGFSWLWAPGLVRYLRSQLTADVILHIHAGRDLISLASAMVTKWSRTPYLLQTHGMIMPDSRLVARLLDVAFVRRMLRSASCIFVLTGAEEQGVQRVGRQKVSIRRIPNGIASVPLPRTPILGGQEVLFLARLHPRKNVLKFAEMAKHLVENGTSADFRVVGPDEGDLAALRQYVEDYGLGNVLTYEGPIAMSEAKTRLARATVFVLPSRGEVFPMTVLESLAVGTPVVTTDDSGIAQDLRVLEAAVITDGSPRELALAVEAVLRDEHLQERLTKNGLAAVENVFSIAAVGSLLDSVYTETSA